MDRPPEIADERVPGADTPGGSTGRVPPAGVWGAGGWGAGGWRAGAWGAAAWGAVVAGVLVLSWWPRWDAATYHPILDQAVHQVLLLDVGTADTPLVGPASTGGMHHPGPLGLVVLALVSRALGGGPEAALVGAGLVALASVVAAVAVVRRVGGPTIGWLFAVGATVLLVSFGVDRVYDVWNPNLALAPFLLFLVSAWAVTCGRWAVLPVAVVSGSFAAQNHLSFVAPVVAVAVWATVAGVRAHRRSPSPIRRWLVAAVVVGVVCWAAPVIEQLTAPRGNVTALLDYSADEQATAGLGTAVGVFARHVGGLPTWTGAAESAATDPGVVDPAPAVALAAPALALAAAAVVAWRRGAGDLLRLVAVVVVATGAAVLTVSRIAGPVYVHYTRAFWAVGLLWWLCVGWAAVVLLAPGWAVAARGVPAQEAPARGRRRVVAAAGVVAVAVVGLLGWLGRPPHPWPSPPREAELSAAIDAAVASLPADLAAPVMVTGDGSLEAQKLQTGIEYQLARAGTPIAVPRWLGVYYGEHRVVAPATTIAVYADASAPGVPAAAVALDVPNPPAILVTTSGSPTGG